MKPQSKSKANKSGGNGGQRRQSASLWTPKLRRATLRTSGGESIMSIRRIIKFFGAWVITWIAVGAIIGIIMGLGDTGHVGTLGTILILVTAGAIFGVVSGGVFAPLFTWLTPQLRARSVRAGVAAVLGTLSGLLGIYIADRVVGITNSFAVGSVAGAITGFVCGALSVSEYGHHKNAA
jgi:hypothetical protein